LLRLELPSRPVALTTVFIVTAVRLYRDALTAAVAAGGRLDIVGTAADVKAARTRIAELRPDVVLIDAAVEPALPAVQELRATSATTKIVVLGLPEDDLEREVLAHVQAGAAGYATRNASLADLIDTVECAARGDMMCSASVAGALARSLALLAQEHKPSRVDAILTAREREIAGLIADGLSNKQIARELHIELPTVKNHVHRILGKLEVSRRGEAAARVHETRIATAVQGARN
jgi:DNA-binding NarL/FixJ family response regulator